jgi:hypothetical protein
VRVVRYSTVTIGLLVGVTTRNAEIRKERKIDWRFRRVLVTDGASFIRLHLADALVVRGAEVRVIDNLSSGRVENIQDHLETSGLSLSMTTC